MLGFRSKESPGQPMNEEAAVLRQAVTMNILIVDDEPTIRETCAEVAKQSGMKAITVATAEEALEVLENSAVDIVLTDLMLQQSSGLELLKRVHDSNPMLPVIVLTQYGTIDSAVAATRLGAVDYVTKPFRIEELRSRLERATRRRVAAGKSAIARTVAHSSRLRRADRRLRAHAARLQNHPKGQPARVSGSYSRRKRHGQGIGGQERSFFRPAQGPAICAGGLFVAGSHLD